MNKFYGTIEFLSGQRAALVTLRDESGEWAGTRRIETKIGSRDSLYEAGYIHAGASAVAKGGRLETYRVGTA